jgi:hypothetical protein
LFVCFFFVLAVLGVKPNTLPLSYILSLSSSLDWSKLIYLALIDLEFLKLLFTLEYWPQYFQAHIAVICGEEKEKRYIEHNLGAVYMSSVICI